MKIKSENYITIQGWMRTELGLKGNDLTVYAIIYGFSQTADQQFKGSLQYLADWCGATKQGIQKNLKNLLDSGLIQKEERDINGVKFCSYSCIPYNSVVQGIQLSCTNNIVDNIDLNKNNLSKDKLLQDSGKFLGSSGSKKKSETKFYSNCIAVINSFTDHPQLRKLLFTYLNIRLSFKDKPLYPNQWKGIVNKLSTLSTDVLTQCNIVQQSIDRGYLSFYPYGDFNIASNSSFDPAVSDRMTDEDYKALDKETEKRKQNGLRTEF